RPAEIERPTGPDSRIERSRHRRRVAAAGNCPKQNDALLVDARPGPQQIHAATQVPRHPADQAVADDMELHADVVAEVVILPAGAKRARITLLIAERMLAALPVAELIHHEHETPQPSPGHAHV